MSYKCATQLKTNFGLKSTKDWNIYEFIDIPGMIDLSILITKFCKRFYNCKLYNIYVVGLILIENPFTAEGQQEWILKCLKEYPKKPNILNIDAHGLLNDDATWWDSCFG